MIGEAWRPAARFEALRARAQLLRRIRQFFDEREVLEVETPVISIAGTVDRHIDSLEVPGAGWLQTSPEFPMKRLLAAGSGPIWQLARVFRAGERGRLHNPEFTMLEWYRPGWDHHRLMDELIELLSACGGPDGAQRLDYAGAFAAADLPDPHRASVTELAAAAAAALPSVPDSLGREADDRGAWLDLLFDGVVVPALGESPVLIHDFPAEQAALARVRPGEPPLAERFELIWQGLELANGFHELTDAAEQRRRFDTDRAWRLAQGRETPPVDGQMLAALEHGLPDCAGVAVGIDRLLMCLTGAQHIDEVLAFPVDRA